MPSLVLTTRSAGTRTRLPYDRSTSCGAVDARRASDETRRIDEVARAARMDDEPRVRQVLHQQARAAGMVEMDVGRDDVVDRVDADAGASERREQARDGVVGARVDEGGAAALDDQVGRVEERAMKAGVDDADAVADRLDERGLGRDGGGGGVDHADGRWEQSDSREGESRARGRATADNSSEARRLCRRDHVMHSIQRRLACSATVLALVALAACTAPAKACSRSDDRRGAPEPSAA